MFIIGGPNGAGKSTISNKLLHPFEIAVFDWDREFHFVSESTIEERFVKGLNLLDKAVLEFNRIFLFNTSNHFNASLIATFNNGRLQQKYQNIPPTYQLKSLKLT